MAASALDATIDVDAPGRPPNTETDRDMDDPHAVGLAALSICEAMLLSLEERGLIDEDERRNLLQDVAETHLRAAARGGDPLLHKAVARIARDLQAGRLPEPRSPAANGKTNG